MDDLISRADMLDAIGHGSTYSSKELQDIIKRMPGVTNQIESKIKSSEFGCEQLVKNGMEYAIKIVNQFSFYKSNCGTYLEEQGGYHDEKNEVEV